MYGTWCKDSIYSREVDGQKCEIMAINTPKLKLLLILEQSSTLRLSGSGIASMFALCRYPMHIILLYPYVRRVSWLIPICSGRWGLFTFLPLSWVVGGLNNLHRNIFLFSLFRFILGIFSQVCINMVKVPWRCSQSLMVYDPHHGRNLTNIFLF